MMHPSQEFDGAVDALCDGTISDDVAARLFELLQNDSDARDEYLWRVEVHGELASRQVETDTGIVKAAEDAGAYSVAPRPMPTRVVRAISIATVAGCVVLIGGVISVVLRREAPSQTNAGVEAAQIVDVQDGRWMDASERAVVGDSIRIGQRIELSSGSVELVFQSGARLKIDGPAIVEPQSGNGVFVAFGEVHLKAETAESKGFRVETPTTTFVDISTAFTASVSPDGLSQLNVSEGEVDVVLSGSVHSPRLRAGERLYVEPGERQVMARIEEGDGTAEFRFPTISPPSRDDYADARSGRALIQVVGGTLNEGAGASGPATVLLDGAGQSTEDSPHETAFFTNDHRGAFLLDLGRTISVSKVNSYSWHQNTTIEAQRHRAVQKFTLYGFAGLTPPELATAPENAGWVRIARVNTDRFFHVEEPLDRPAQQACSITSARGEIGRFRFLLWEVDGVPGFQTESVNHTFYGEFDVFGSP